MSNCRTAPKKIISLRTFQNLDRMNLLGKKIIAVIINLCCYLVLLKMKNIRLMVLITKVNYIQFNKLYQ